MRSLKVQILVLGQEIPVFYFELHFIRLVFFIIMIRLQPQQKDWHENNVYESC